MGDIDIDSQLIVANAATSIQQGKSSLSNKLCWHNWMSIRKDKPQYLPLTTYKIDLKWVKNVNLQIENPYKEILANFFLSLT